MPDHFKTIYQQHGHQYERLVAREDYKENLAATIRRLVSLDGSDVVEMGAGTGRITRIMVRQARHVAAFDLHAHMLSVARPILKRIRPAGWQLAVADSRRLPVAAHSADLVVEGWSFGHFTEWYSETWRAEVQQALDEMLRVVRPGGTLLVIETLGTGLPKPRPPAPRLADLYTMLETDYGFSSTVIRTDYQFRSQREAEELTRFFFGDQFGQLVHERRWKVVPEFTGVWSRRVD